MSDPRYPYRSNFGADVAPTTYLDRLGELPDIDGTLAAWPGEILKTLRGGLADFRGGLTGSTPAYAGRPAPSPGPSDALGSLASPIGDLLTQQEVNDQATAVKEYAAQQAQAVQGMRGSSGDLGPAPPVEAPAEPLMFSMGGAPMGAYNPKGASRADRLGIGGFNGPFGVETVHDRVGGAGVTAGGSDPNRPDGDPSASFIQGTPEIQARLAVEDAQRRAAVGEAEAGARSWEVPESTESMPNELGLTRAELIQAVIASMKQRQDPTMGVLGTSLDIGQRASQELMRDIAAAEKSIQDPVARAAAVRDIQSTWKMKWDPYFRALESARGIRPQD